MRWKVLNDNIFWIKYHCVQFEPSKMATSLKTKMQLFTSRILNKEITLSKLRKHDVKSSSFEGFFRTVEPWTR